MINRTNGQTTIDQLNHNTALLATAVADLNKQTGLLAEAIRVLGEVARKTTCRIELLELEMNTLKK